MDLTVTQRTLPRRVRVPPSKSITHRALLLAAHATEPCMVRRPLMAGDGATTLRALEAFGAITRRRGEDVELHNEGLHAPARVDCENAGTTLRLLLGLAARFDQPVSFDGDASLRGRPNGPLLAALAHAGATVTRSTLPITIQGPIRAGRFTIDGSTSSQFVSSLMLSLPFLPGDSHLAAQGAASRPYLDVTRHVAAAFGIDTGIGSIEGGQHVDARTFTVEADWSSAAFPLVAAAITGSPLAVEGLAVDSLQGDRRILDHLLAFGAEVDGTHVRGGTLRTPGTVDVRDGPDMFPALCILAACSEGTTTFVGGAALRHKESDRIAAMAAGLRALGIRCDERPEGLVVHGGRLHGGHVDARSDHRIHMAFAIAGLVADGPVTVSDRECAAISYPGFHALLESP